MIGSASIDSAKTEKQRLAIKHFERGGFRCQWIDHRDSQICMSRNRNGSIRIVYVNVDGSFN